MHCLFFPDLLERGDRLTIEGDEARHASRVKRLETGEELLLLDGRGTVARARVVEARRLLVLDVVSRETRAEVMPRVEVMSATPKGPRLGELIEGLVQVGAASWTPMSTKLGVVDPGESKLARVERIVVEALKQSRRAHLMEIGEKADLDGALESAGAAGARVVVADASGGPFVATGAERIRLLVGPEGGFTVQELHRARGAGAMVASFGPHTMRIETAAPVAAAVILMMESAHRAGAERNGAS